MNLFFFLLSIYLVFFHTNYLPLNDTVALGTLVSLNLFYLFHGVFLKLFYDSCEMGKHFHSTYGHLDSIPSKNAFDLVYYNVWGH